MDITSLGIYLGPHFMYTCSCIPFDWLKLPRPASAPSFAHMHLLTAGLL